jgi:site-specific recombinase XerD
VHFSETCAILLTEYLETHPKDAAALFLNQHGDRLCRQSIYNIVSRLGKKAGLVCKLGPHRLRHTFATNLLARGADLGFIAGELGHADLNTTRIYANLPDPQLVAHYRQYMG